MIIELPPDPPEHVILAALQWREEQAKRSKAPEPEQQAKPNGHAEPLPCFSASTAKGKQRAREFLDSGNIFPLRNVAIVSGDGGTGKSLVAMQLALACTTGMQWLGMDVMQCPVVYFSAEDDRQEMINRLNEICEAEGIDLESAWQLHILPMVGGNTVLAAEQKDGTLKTTEVYERLCVTLEQIAPGLLILDNLADVFSGNENSRTAAKQFIGKLRWLCIKYDCVIILIGHPSLTGRSSGTGESGSTGWNNSVRVRCYLQKPDGPDADADARTFVVKKANYTAGGQRINLKWLDHRFIVTDPPSILDAVTVDEVDEIKLMFGPERRWRVKEQSDDWGGHAVAQVLDLDVGRGIGAKERNGEQNKNRETIRKLLNVWLFAKSIFIVDGVDSYRRPTKFFSNRDPEEKA